MKILMGVVYRSHPSLDTVSLQDLHRNNQSSPEEYHLQEGSHNKEKHHSHTYTCTHLP